MGATSEFLAMVPRRSDGKRNWPPELKARPTLAHFSRAASPRPIADPSLHALNSAQRPRARRPARNGQPRGDEPATQQHPSPKAESLEIFAGVEKRKLFEVLLRIMRDSDLTQVSAKNLRLSAEAELGLAVDALKVHKDEVKDMVKTRRAR